MDRNLLEEDCLQSFKVDWGISEEDEHLGRHPDDAVAYCRRGWYHEQKKEYELAIADWETSIRLDPNQADAYRQLARLLAACPRAEHRDGRRAVELALRALWNCKPSGDWMHRYCLNTLAAAYAEAEEFDKAVEAQTEAISRYVRNTRAEPLHVLRELYRLRRPYRRDMRLRHEIR
jgi:tetratricopeptide (TPR) repeat protein